MRAIAGVSAVLGLFLATATAAQVKKDKSDADKIPKAVLDALKSKFLRAEIVKWTREKEGDAVVYDLECKQDGRKCEADVKPDGTILNYEKEIAAKDLPDAVRKALDKKYPGAALKEVMEITEIKDKKEVLEGYGIVFDTADKKEVEVTIAPDGKFLEDSTEQKEEKK
jgi:hypothetical protein